MTALKFLTAPNYKRPFLTYGLAIVVLMSALTLFNVFERPNLFMLDRAFQWRGVSEPRDEIAIVAISQRDFEMGAPRWPWPRSFMARLIDRISEQEPAVIVVDILYSETTNTESVVSQSRFEEIQPFLYQVLSGVPLEVKTRDGVSTIGPGSAAFDEITDGAVQAALQDVELVNAVRLAQANGVSVVLASHSISSDNVVGLTRPFPALNEVVVSSTGLVGIRLDSDGILRRYIPYGSDETGQYQYAMAMVAVAEYLGAELPAEPSSNGNVVISDEVVAEVDHGEFLVNFRGPPGTHTTYDAIDVLKERDGLGEDLRGKIVFLGVTDPSVEDMVPTPYSGTDRMAGVEFHAAAADTILSQRFIGQTPVAAEVALIVLLAGLAIFLGRYQTIMSAVGGLALVMGTLTAAWLLLFMKLDFIFPMATLVSVTSLAFVAALADKVGVEQFEKQRARAMLSRYLAPTVVTDMLRGSGVDGLGGTRSEISVLFSDIRGFTSISENLEPEQTVELLNRYLDVMTDVVFNNGGTVDKFEGDAILAFFGAPQSQPDHAKRAVNTALEMIARLSGLEELWQERTGTTLRIGVGIHTGEAFIGNIGSQRRMDYTIIGDTVNLASRLQDLTKEHGVSILLSGIAKEKAGNIARYRDLGSIQVRGRQQPVELFEACSASPAAEGDINFVNSELTKAAYQPINAD